MAAGTICSDFGAPPKKSLPIIWETWVWFLGWEDPLEKGKAAGQEERVRTGHGTPDWFQIGKGVRQGCILSPYLFNLHAEYIMQNAGLDKAQSGIKTVGRNVNNLRYADDTTLMAESEEELKNLLMKWKRKVKKLA